MARPLRILLVAEEAAGVQALRMLAASSHHVVAVMTGGRAGMVGGATVAGIAARLGYPLWPMRQVKQDGFHEVVRREDVDLLLNVHSLYVLPAELVAAPRIGSFNLHPGPLPGYAGLNAPSWAIYQGERTHAVTVHWMDGGIDTGPIAYESIIAVEEDETGLTLSAKCVRAGLPLLHDLLRDASRDEVPRHAQPAGIRRYYGREVPHDGQLFWSESAGRIVSFVRACDYLPFVSPWGHPRAWISGREISVLKAGPADGVPDDAPGTVGQRAGEDVLVAAGDGWVRVRRVQVGNSTFSAAQVLQPGERFALPLRREELSSASR
jgi:methionyl-tRNA formyltransferase